MCSWFYLIHIFTVIALFIVKCIITDALLDIKRYYYTDYGNRLITVYSVLYVCFHLLHSSIIALLCYLLLNVSVLMTDLK